MAPSQALPAGPLSGVLAVDFTHVLSGPYCTMMLADNGARVIKVERPGKGDDARHYGPFLDKESVYFGFVNRGKESIALDMKDPADHKLALDIIRQADVLVENFRPGTMKKLGLDYAALEKINPRLVYASISGFGQTGPMSQKAAYDTVIQGVSGLMSVTGWPDGPPTRVGTSISDLSAGLFAYAAITSALYEREKSGKGMYIDIAMLDSVYAVLENALMDFCALQKSPGRRGNRHPSIAPFDTFRTSDREIIICVGSNSLFRKLCEAIGCGACAGDPRFDTNERRAKNISALKDILEKALVTRSAAQWIETLEAAGVPCGLVNSIAETTGLEQIRARNMTVASGKLHMPGNPLKMNRYPDKTAFGPPPRLGEHAEKIRKEFSTVTKETKP